MKNNINNEDELYWLNQFREEIPVLEWPADKKSYLLQRTRKKVDFTYNIDFLVKINEFVELNQLSLPVILMTGFAALLYRYTGQKEIILGTSKNEIKPALNGETSFNPLAIRTGIDEPQQSFRQLLFKVKNVYSEAIKHSPYSFKELVKKLKQENSQTKTRLFDIFLLFQDNFDIKDNKYHTYFQSDNGSVPNLFLIFSKCNGELKLYTEYNADIFQEQQISNLFSHLENIISSGIGEKENYIEEINYLSISEWKNFLGEDLQIQPHFTDKTLVELFEKQARQNPKNVAVIYEGNTLTYEELNARANQLAWFLINTIKTEKGEKIGLLLNKNTFCIVSILGILKAGCGYVPIHTSSNYSRIKFVLQDTASRILITEKEFMETANRLQWETESLKNYICINSQDIYNEDEAYQNPMMEKDLWDFVGEGSSDTIDGGGWLSSYTGLPFTPVEMEEYAVNAQTKLLNVITGDSKVLEIGCSSGITLRKIAPFVKEYYATDLSDIILDKTRSECEKEGIGNLIFKHLPAHEISKIETGDFDLIILNSVIQHFHGHNYLRKVIHEATAMLSPNGKIFIGDVMDVERKEDLISDLTQFRQNNPNHKTKTDFSAELFVHKDFFRDLLIDEHELKNVKISDKIFSVENELTRYRYDVLLEADKNCSVKHTEHKTKYQFDNTSLIQEKDTNPQCEINGEDLAYIIYTSGTTGLPKGVEIRHKNILNLFNGTNSLFHFNEKDNWIMCHSYSFDFSVWEIFGALIYGGKLFLPADSTVRNSKQLLGFLSEHHITVFNQTPSAFYKLNEELEEEVLCIKYIIFGGERLNLGKLKTWKNQFPETKLINMYGITETTVHTTFKEISSKNIEEGISNIGLPLPTLKTYIFDHQMKPVPEGIVGELYVSGESLSSGYINQPALTASRFFQNPYKPEETLYRTGDLVYRSFDGDLIYKGRVDQQVKIMGFRIELGEIETHLSKLEYIKEVVADAKEVNGEKVLVAYYTTAESISVDRSELRTYLADKLPDYMLPGYFIKIDHFPVTSNGKIDKSSLPDITGHDVIRKEYIKPESDTEKALTRIWENVLNVDKIGITDNFFELGGHSLKVGQAINKIYETLSLQISFKDFFSSPTIQDLCKKLQKKTFRSINRIPESENYPMSASQQRIWILSQIGKSSEAYNIPIAIRLKGKLNKNLFQKAFQLLINKHEILRTSFKTDPNSGEIRQYIIQEENIQFAISEADFKGREEKDIDEYLKQLSSKTFDLSQAPLLKAYLLSKTEDDHIFFFSMHHIIGDGWSVEVLISEAVDTYNRLLKGKNTTYVSLPVQYKDYVVWLQEEIGKEKYKEAEKYWLNEFSGEIPVLELPGYKARPLIQTYNGNSINHIFSEKFTQKLKKFSEKHEVTLFMTLMTAVKILLYRYTGQNDIIVGIPVAGREHPDLENQIGLYLNTLAIRTKFEEQNTFEVLLKKEKESLLSAYENQIYPFDELIGKLKLKRDIRRSALFDVLVVLQSQKQLHWEKKLNEIQQLNASFIKLFPETSQVDLSYKFSEEKEQFELTIEYNTDIYDLAFISRMISHFENLLTNVMEYEGLNLNIEEIDFLEEAERNQLLYEFNGIISTFPDKTIIEIFEDQAVKTPENVAVIFENIKLTYKQLNEKANQLGNYLRQNYHIQPDDLISIQLERSEEMIISILAILKSGAAYVPIDPEYPQERIKYIEQDILAKATIDRNFLNNFHAESENYSKDNLSVLYRPESLAYIIYTSGTTGTPKGVMIENRNVVQLFFSDNNLFDFNENDTWSMFHYYGFDFSVWEMYGALLFGGQLVIVSKHIAQSAVEFLDLLETHKVTVLNQTPSAFYNLISHEEKHGLEKLSLRYIIFGGEALQPSKLSSWKKLYPEVKLINMYGITETTVHVTYKEIRDEELKSERSMIGRPIPTLNCYVLNDSRKPVPIGCYGSLYVSGAGVSRGYLNLEQLTSQKFKDNPYDSDYKMYDSGDLVRWLPDGDLEYKGRKDMQVKIRGYRIELGEIESFIYQYDEKIKQVLVEMKPFNNEKVLAVYYTIDQKDEVKKEELREYLQKYLPDYMIPNFFIKLEKIPLNSNGKINRNVLPDVNEHYLIRKEYIAPRNETEKKLTEIWQHVLGIEKISITDNFFEIGGNSLLANKLAILVKMEMDIELTWVILMRNPNIQDLYDYLYLTYDLEEAEEYNILDI